MENLWHFVTFACCISRMNAIWIGMNTWRVITLTQMSHHSLVGVSRHESWHLHVATLSCAHADGALGMTWHACMWYITQTSLVGYFVVQIYIPICACTTCACARCPTRTRKMLHNMSTCMCTLDVMTTFCTRDNLHVAKCHTLCIRVFAHLCLGTFACVLHVCRARSM